MRGPAAEQIVFHPENLSYSLLSVISKQILDYLCKINQNRNRMCSLLFALGMPEVIILVFLILLLFGAKRIPELMKSMGKGVRSFKEGMNEIGKDLDTDNKDGKYQKDETK